MGFNRLMAVLAAGSLLAGSAPALALQAAPGQQPPSSPPPAAVPANASPVSRVATAVARNPGAAVAAALAGLVGFTVVLSQGGNSSRQRPTSP